MDTYLFAQQRERLVDAISQLFLSFYFSVIYFVSTIQNKPTDFFFLLPKKTLRQLQDFKSQKLMTKPR